MKAFKEWLEQFKIKCPHCGGTGKIMDIICCWCNGEEKIIAKHIEFEEVWKAALEWIKTLGTKIEHGTFIEISKLINEELKDG